MNKTSLSIRPSYWGWGRGRRERKAWHKNHSANRVTHSKSGCSSDWITHNTPWRHRPQERSARRRSFKFFVDVLISCYRYVILLQTETKRGIQKGSRGRSQVLFWNKNKTRAKIVFSRFRSLKERCTRSMEKPHMVSQDRDKEDDIRVSDI